MDRPLTVDMRGAPFEVDLLALNDRESMLMLAISPGTAKENVMVLIVDKEQIRIKEQPIKAVG